jgi:hypothetical protein
MISINQLRIATTRPPPRRPTESLEDRSCTSVLACHLSSSGVLGSLGVSSRPVESSASRIGTELKVESNLVQ